MCRKYRVNDWLFATEVDEDRSDCTHTRGIFVAICDLKQDRDGIRVGDLTANGYPAAGVGEFVSQSLRQRVQVTSDDSNSNGQIKVEFVFEHLTKRFGEELSSENFDTTRDICSRIIVSEIRSFVEGNRVERHWNFCRFINRLNEDVEEFCSCQVPRINRRRGIEEDTTRNKLLYDFKISSALLLLLLLNGVDEGDISHCDARRISIHLKLQLCSSRLFIHTILILLDCKITKTNIINGELDFGEKNFFAEGLWK